MKTLAFTLSLGLLAVPLTGASAGSLRGRVVVRSAVASAPVNLHAYPGQASSMGRSMAMPRGAVTDAVVFIQEAPAAVDSIYRDRPMKAELRQKNECFVPRVVAIAVGGSVAFPNDDPVYHNVFSPTPIRRFDLGKYARGHSRSVRFPRAGVVRVFCDIHSHMEAYVLVVPNHVFVRPDAEGRFELPDLPAGRYRVRVWHPDLPESSREIEVTAGAETVIELGL